MKACRLHKPADFRCDEIDIPEPTGEQLLLKVSSCGICGSDIPRIFINGTTNGKYPCTIGHEFGGEIVKVGPDADASLVGKCGAVFPLIPCMKCNQCKKQYYAMCEDYDYMGSRTNGGFAEYCLIPSAWHFIEAPANMNKDSFGLVEPCTVAQHAVRTALADENESIIIFGAGPIGIMAARWANILGFKHVMLVDVDDEKVKFAVNAGVKCINSTKEDILEAWKDFSGQNHCNAAIEGTGFGSALGSCIEAVGHHGTVVLMGTPGADTQIKQSQHGLILRKELVIKGIWNSYFKAKNIDEWKCTIEEISKRRMKVNDLITHKVSLEEIPKTCEKIYNKKIQICKVISSCI